VTAEVRARRLCPWCGAPLAPPAGGRQTCPGCGEPFYHNAKPCVAVLLEDERGRVLLGRRAVEPELGRWDLPGGFLDAGETPEEAAHRELREETGAEIELMGFLGHVVDRYGATGDHTLNCIYVGRVIAGEPMAADDVAELRWFAPEDLPPPDELAFANTAEALTRWVRRRSG
jgi:ADP-ribose pyrophosphatase YjhB (NUDIX family)